MDQVQNKSDASWLACKHAVRNATSVATGATNEATLAMNAEKHAIMGVMEKVHKAIERLGRRGTRKKLQP